MRRGHMVHRRVHGSAGDHSGVLVNHARRYEFRAAIGYLGRRRRVFDGLVALSGARPGDHVLDIGCGTGYFTRRAARAIIPGGHAVGIDPSRPVIDYASRRAPANCDFEIASAQRLPQPDGSFDVVVSSLAIHHLHPDDRPAALREMYRVLRPGGRLLIAEFREQPRHIRVARLVGVLRRHAAHHERIRALTDLISGAGFHVTGAGDRWPSLRYVQAEVPRSVQATAMHGNVSEEPPS